MERQHRIERKLSAPESMEIIRGLLAECAQGSRAVLVQGTFSQFGFVDARGRAQTAGCARALRELEQAGHSAPRCGRPAAAAVAQAKSAASGAWAHLCRNLTMFPAQADDVQGLTLVQVHTPHQLRVWNELMACEHPQWPGPLVGAQMRKLITSDCGRLGGLGFGAAALNLADRDRWIGWGGATRRQRLHRVVGMAPFLIRCSESCHNLASRALGMVLRAVAPDHEARYDCRPWLLGSFVDTEQSVGVCCQAGRKRVGCRMPRRAAGATGAFRPWWRTMVAHAGSARW